MTTMLLVVLSAALVASALALAREQRIRRALEKLIRILLNRWRTHVTKVDSDNLDGPDYVHGRDERL